MVGAGGLVEGHESRLDGDRADVGDGVAGVDAQIGQDLVDLGGVHLDRPQTAFGRQARSMSSPMSRCSILSMPATVSFKSQHLGSDGLLASEGQQLAGEVGGAVGRLADLDKVGMERLGRVHLVEGHLRVPEDHPQHVVEVVGHAAGQAAHRLHLLGLLELGLEFLPLRLGLFALGDVAGVDHHPVQAWVVLQVVADRLDDPIGTILVPDAHLRRSIDQAESLQAKGDRLRFGGQVVGVDEIRDVPTTDLLRLESQHPLHRRADVPAGAVEVQLHDQVDGVFDQAPKALFALLQRRFCIPALADHRAHGQADDAVADHQQFEFAQSRQIGSKEPGRQNDAGVRRHDPRGDALEAALQRDPDERHGDQVQGSKLARHARAKDPAENEHQAGRLRDDRER